MRGSAKALVAAAVVLAIPLAAPVAQAGTTDVTVKLACDNYYDLYVSADDSVPGIYVGSSPGDVPGGPYDWQTTEVWTIAVPDGESVYLHVAGYNFLHGGAASAAALIGQLELPTGRVFQETDADKIYTSALLWKVNGTGFGAPMDPAVWAGGYGSPPWGSGPSGFDPAADWIWLAGPGSRPPGEWAYFSLKLTVNQLPQPLVVAASGASPTYVENAPPVTVDPGITVVDPDGPNLTGAKVLISANFLAGSDLLEYTPTAGISGSYDSATGVLTLTGDAPAAGYEAAFRAVQYRNSSDDPGALPRTVSFYAANAATHFAGTGHYYEYVSTPLSWANARAAAQARSLHGAQGYLATVTSAAENAFIKRLLLANAWMGASDAALEGTWRWVTGPEGLEDGGQGRHFFTQTPGGSGGTGVPGEYANWAGGEPNNYGSGEDYAHFYTNGYWNDGAGGAAPYVVEYGGMPGDPVLQIAADVIVNVQPVDDPPVASNDAYATDEETPLMVPPAGVLANDTDPDSALAVVAFPATSALGAAVSVSPGGGFLYDPSVSSALNALAVGETATDTFTYTIQGTPGFSVKVYDTTAGIGNVGAAEAVLTEGQLVGRAPSLTLNINNNPNAGDTGLFPGDTGVPGLPSNSDTFVIEATAQIQVSAAGQYTFGVNSDDGFGLTIPGATLLSVTNGPGSTIGGDFLAYDGNRAAGTTLGVFSFPAAGVYSLRLIYWESGGSASVELFAATGAHTSVGSQFQLVGNIPALLLPSYGAAATATVTITVTGLNDPPVAIADTGATDDNTVLTVPAPGVLANDIEPDANDTLTVATFDATSALGAAVAVNPDGSYTYDPTVSAALNALKAGEVATDTFTYKITDGHPDLTGLRVKVYDSTSSIGNVATAESLITAGNLVVSTTADTVNMNNNPNAADTGLFPGDAGVPGIPDYADTFVIEATTHVLIPAAGQYTFGVNSDDGFGLRIVGATLQSVTNGPGSTIGGDFLAFNGNRPTGLTLGVFSFPAPGAYPLRLVQWENGGYANVELLAAAGAHTSTGPQFKLVGDPAGLVCGSYVATVTITVAGVNDAPTADAGPDQTLEQTSLAGAEVTLDGSGSSDPDGGLLSYAWSEGATQLATGVSPTLTLSLGVHTVTLTVDDGDGGTDTDDVVITIQDTTDPVLITVPADITVEQATAAGTEVTWECIAEDICDAEVVVISEPPSGTVFALGGPYTVTCTATDDSGNERVKTFTVTVIDTTPPELVVPDPIVVEQATEDGTKVELNCVAADVCDAQVDVECVPASGSVFPLGVTTVTCTATDYSGNQTVKSFDVTVVDTTPPVIESVLASPNALWSPNHKMVDIAIGAVVRDICDAAPAWEITGVASNEPINGLGDGDTAPDWEFSGQSLKLRAERSGKGSGRVYTITIQVTDASGNAATDEVTVAVPHDKRR